MMNQEVGAKEVVQNVASFDKGGLKGVDERVDALLQTPR